jgi:CubicO group peptidase (beta-lactamase class C family)
MNLPGIKISGSCRLAVLAPLGLAAIITMISNVAAQAQPSTSPAAVDSIIRKLDQSGMPGCSVSVIQRGSLTLTRSYGLAEIENNVPINAETRFDIGSMSKQFLAMAILILTSDGKLDLDDDVHKYVPELPRYQWKITLRDLIHHTSGLKDYDQLLQVAGWRDGDIKSVSDIKWIIERQKRLAFTPGTQYSYSDTNYFLLGLIAQRVTAKPLNILLEDMIFRPLGMTHTSLRTDHWSLVPHKAWPYRIVDGKPQLFINAEEPLGDGGIFTTVGDLALWERNFDEAKVAGAQVIREMHELRPLSDGSTNDYASGLYIREYHGLRMIEHSGASYGYLAEKLRFPEQQLSVIVLCNRRDGPYVDLSNRLADYFLGLKDDVPRLAAVSSPKAELERFAGFYFSDSVSDGVLIEARDGALFDAGEDREYRQSGPMTFESSSAGTLCRCSTTYTFQVDSDGRVKGFTAARPSKRVSKVATAFYARMKPARKIALADYVGEYVSADVAATWCVLQKDDGLFVRRRGFADRQLQLLWEDAAAGPSGILQFQRQRDQVTGFLLRNVRLGSVEFQRPPGDHRPNSGLGNCP